MSKLKKKPIELMHLYFGVKGGIHCCGTCCNLLTLKKGQRTVRKCKAFGVTSSASSDFAKRWDACGLYGEEVFSPAISDTARKMFRRIGVYDEVMQNQIELR